MNTVNEVKLIKKLRKGDTTAFHVLYNTWSGKLYNFVMSISNNDTYLAEEIVQSIFLSVWEKREEIDSNKSFGAFLCTIAKNRLTNHYKHQLIEKQYQKQYEEKLQKGEPTTEQDVNYHLLVELVDHIIEQLPPARKQIYELSKQKHLSNKAIAELLNLSENTVESQLSKANTFVRNKLLIHYDVGIALFFHFMMG